MNKGGIPKISEKDFLYKNFLTKKTIYKQNEAYWERSIHRLLSELGLESECWCVNEFAKGNSIDDGNPIYSAKIRSGKAFRIIQEEPKSDRIRMGAWTQSVEDKNGHQFVELVIFLELTKQTKKIALELIKEWAKITTTRGGIDVFITEILP